jgi:hypothetical protein
MNPRHRSEILDTLPSFEDLAIVFDVEFSDADTLGAASRRRDCVLVFLV